MNNISVLNARNFIREGGKFGFFTATSYELQGDRIVLIATCEKCSAKNRIPWTHVNVEARTPGSVLCVNRERHAPEAKAAAPNWQTMTDAEFRAFVSKLSSDDYLKLARSNSDFAVRDKATERKQINRTQAITAKEQADRAAVYDKAHKVFVNAYYAYERQGLNCPFDMTGWLAMDEASRAAVIKQFDLNNVDHHRLSMDALFGRA